MSSCPPSAVWPSTSSVAGLTLSNRAPDAASTSSPSMSRRLSGPTAPALVSIIAAFLPGCRCDLRLDHAQRSPSSPDPDTESDTAVVSASVTSHSADAWCPQARGAVSGCGSLLTRPHLTRSGPEWHTFGNRKVHLIDVTVRVSVTFQGASGEADGVPLQLTEIVEGVRRCVDGFRDLRCWWSRRAPPWRRAARPEAPARTRAPDRTRAGPRRSRSVSLPT